VVSYHFVQDAEEIFDVVDASDRVIGQAPRAEVHARKLRHRAVHVFVFNPRGELFIQKRAATKDTFPGCYDSSASGHLNQGETYDACAVRELHEELGVIVEQGGLQKQFKIEACELTGWEFVWVYSLQTSEEPLVNQQEIESGAFWSLAQVRAGLAAHPDDFAPGFTCIFGGFDRRGLWPNRR
jgi:isopentenyl-diphosphate delta-isomerase type 1